MIDEKYYELDREGVISSDFWTNRLYEVAYSKVGDKKYPIVIPSYNRPENGFCKWATARFDPNETWPIYIVVRDSQVKQYEESKYIKGYDYIKVVGFPDSEIDDIGKVRKKIVEHFSKTESCIFMLDDDLTRFTYTVPYKRESGAKISLSLTKEIESPARVFAMWQLAHERAILLRDDLITSAPMIAGFNWETSFCDEAQSLRFMSGPQSLAVCLNLKTFDKYNINYRSIIGNGHDDIDLLIRALLAGCTTCEFRWISYFNPGIGTSILNFESVEKRFAQQYQEMYDNFHDVDFVKWKHSKGGKALDNVGVNWARAIKYHDEVLTNATPIGTRFYNLVDELNI